MGTAHPPIVDSEPLRRLRSGAAPEDLGPAWPMVSGPFPSDPVGPPGPSDPDGPVDRKESHGPRPDEAFSVTFAVRAPVGHHVLLHINGMVDSRRDDFAWALLPEVHRTGAEAVHAQAYLLPRGLCSSYRIVVAERLDPQAGTTRQGWKAVHEAGGPDPLNPGPTLPTPLGGDASLLRLPGCGGHPAWEEPDPRGGGRDRALVGEEPLGPGVSLLDTGRHDAVAVVFDAEQWRAVGLRQALSRMGSLVPSLVLVDSDLQGTSKEDARSRASFLPDADAVAAVVTPALTALARRGVWAGLNRERVLATGQSFGGLAAVGAVASTGWAGTALAQSASLHHLVPRPGEPRPGRAAGLGTLLREIEAAGPARRPGRIDLVAGTEEAGQLQVAHEGGEVLREAGHDVTVRSRVGGHDYAWWRYELVETLSAFAR